MSTMTTTAGTTEPVPLRRNLRFQALWGGSAAAMLGTCVADTAYPLLLLAMTGSPALAGSFGAVQFTAMVLFGLHGGVVADRHDRRRILIAADSVRLVAAGSVLLALELHRLTVAHTLLVAAVLGVSMAYGAPVRMLAVRAVVPAEQLRQALAQDELRVNGATLIGPPLAGFLTGLGSAVPFLATALASLTALSASLAVRFDSRPDGGTPERGGGLDGLRHVLRNPALRATVTVVLVLNLAGTAMLLAVMVLLRDGGTSTTGIGLALAGEAVGGLLGAPLVSGLHRMMAPGVLQLAVGWTAVPLMLVPTAVGGPVAVFAALAAMMLGVPALRVMLDVLVFQRVADELRGRVIAATMTALMLGTPVGTFGAGLLLDTFAPATVLELVAGLTALALLPLTLGPTLRRATWPA